VLNHLLSNKTLTNLIEAENLYGKKAYPLINFLDDLDEGMWTELQTYDTISSYRRNLQHAYTDKLIELIKPTKNDRDFRDVAPILVNKLGEIQARIKKALPRTKGAMTVYHLKFIDNKIHTALTALSN
jgi:hypothetical protein